MKPPILIVALLVSSAATSSLAADKAQKRLEHKVEQAMLYVNMKLPDRAKESLETLVQSEPGKSDALTWLALSKAHFALKALDDAGEALSRAEGLGVEQAILKKRWAKNYYGEIKELVGGVRVRGATCEEVTFRARLATPMVNRKKRALLEALSGWRKKEFRRRTDRPFFLPAGKFKLGETKVKIIPGQVTSVTAEEIGAQCPAVPTALAATKSSPGGTISATGATAVTDTTAAPDSSGGFLSKNWVWLVIGAVAVAGGASTAAVLATQDSGPDRFRQVF